MRLASVRHLILAMGVVWVGCAPTATVHQYRPAPVDHGPVRDLVLAEVEGTWGVRQVLRQELERQLAASSWWTLQKDREGRDTWDEEDERSDRDFGSTSRPSSRMKQRPPSPSPRPSDTSPVFLFVRTETAFVRSGIGQRQTPSGVVETRLYQGVVELLARTEREGRTILHPKVYRGEAVIEVLPDRAAGARQAVARQALTQAVARLVKDITPPFVTMQIPFDESDEAMKPILQMVKEGRYRTAKDELMAWLRREPERADVTYNLGVICDALREFETALAYYDRAIELQKRAEEEYRQSLQRAKETGGEKPRKVRHKGFYERTRAACAERLRIEKTLTPPPEEFIPEPSSEKEEILTL